MKRYTVTIEFNHGGRKSELTKWADSAEEAEKLAIKDWRIDPQMAKSITTKCDTEH